MLEVLGVTEVEEALYRELLNLQRASLNDLSQAAEISSTRARKALSELEVKGLVSRLPGRTVRYLAAAPDIALEALVQRRQRELEGLRASASELLDQFHRGIGRGRDSREFVEVVTGREAVVQRFKQIEQSARVEILMFNKPPYASVGLNELELQQLAAGVRYRVVYDRSAFEVAGQVDWIAAQTAAGEEARVLSGVPMKIAIADRRLAAVPLYVEDPWNGEPGIEEALIVHRGSLLDALADNFETLWPRAIPLRSLASSNGHTAWVEEGLSATDRKVLSLLAAGLKDEAIARQLRMGARTVQRRVRRVMDLLGADTRFQAGLEAGKRGWL